jgi:hypothetical protein
MPSSVDLLSQAVTGCHFFDSLANMSIHHVETTEQNWQQPFPKRLASGHPLVIAPPSMMVRTIKLGTWDYPQQPLKKLLVSQVHSQSNLRLAPITAEMAFANQNANQETFFEVGHGLSSLQGRLFHCQVSRETSGVSP